MKKILVYAFVLMVSATSCRDDEGSIRLNIFTPEDDKQLGMNLRDEINSDPENYPLLSESAYPEAYAHLRRITNNIVESGELRFETEFDWETYIIHDDEVLNAFCAPGGYMYVYTGLIKYLDSEDALAGVMGHEIAHADRRHGTDRLTRAYGISLLLDIILGKERSMLADIAASLTILSYSRSQETDADEYSVRYLYKTDYDPRGVARFFEKLEDESGGVSMPEFLSSHPSPSNRIENIYRLWEEMGSQEGERFVSRYQNFKNSLP
jgi:beta-barrel assembly-enhancing protease